MNKFLHFLVLTFIVLSSFIVAQTQPSMVRFDYPEYIPVNLEFDASIVFKFDEMPNQNVSLAFEKDQSVRVLSASLYTDGSSKNIDFNLSGNEISFLLNQVDFNFVDGQPYQILLACKGKESKKVNNKLFRNQNDDIKLSDEFIEETSTHFYNPQEASGKSLQFSDESNLQFNVNNKEDWQNIYFEFWLKSDSKLSCFLDIIEPTTNDTLLCFSKNKLNFLSLPFDESELFRDDVYLGKGSWNYFGVKLTKNFNDVLAEVFVNTELVYSIPVNASGELSNLSYSFATDNKDEKFYIDRLKLWDFDNNIKLANSNKHFTNILADSSQILFNLNFDNTSELNNAKESEEIIFDIKNVKLIKSDAPIFSKAPKLNVTIGSAYNSIVWYVQEYSFAKEFMLEKAIGDEEYQTVYETTADDDPLKIYNYADEVVNINEVAYYRVRQINKDNSVATSAEVKIGNKEAEEFRLHQNYPNPFNPQTSIFVDVVIATEFEVNVYDLVGNKVEQLHDGFLPQG
ncbi:MAG: hypothetical protein GY936_14175, partial [Ignavibacteriae bacterium]|nr:hypothetical protein [Ignavibacteriota bacterium]